MIKKYFVQMSLNSVSFIILLAGWGNYRFLLAGARDLLAEVDNLQRIVEQEDWEQATASLDGVISTWQKTKKYWPMLIHHEEMDRIEESMNKIKSYIKYKDTAQTMAELYNLAYFIKHIPQKEAFNLQNIF